MHNLNHNFFTKKVDILEFQILFPEVPHDADASADTDDEAEQNWQRWKKPNLKKSENQLFFI